MKRNAKIIIFGAGAALAGKYVISMLDPGQKGRRVTLAKEMLNDAPLGSALLIAGSVLLFEPIVKKQL